MNLLFHYVEMYVQIWGGRNLSMPHKKNKGNIEVKFSPKGLIRL